MQSFSTVVGIEILPPLSPAGECVPPSFGWGGGGGGELHTRLRERGEGPNSDEGTCRVQTLLYSRYLCTLWGGVWADLERD